MKKYLAENLKYFGYDLKQFLHKDYGMFEEEDAFGKMFGSNTVYQGFFNDPKGYFSKMNISDNLNEGSRSIALYKFHTDEATIKSIIADLFACFGDDKLNRGEMIEADKENMTYSENRLPVRLWEGDDLNVIFNVNLENYFIYLNIKLKDWQIGK